MPKLDSSWIQTLHPNALQIGDDVVVVGDPFSEMVTSFSLSFRDQVLEQGLSAWGLMATVVGFALHHVGRNYVQMLNAEQPGFFYDRIYPRIRFAKDDQPLGLFNGEEIWTRAENLMVADRPTYRRRLQELRDRVDERPRYLMHDFVCPLPDTTFWEGDLVRVRADVVLGERKLSASDPKDPRSFRIYSLDFGMPLMHKLRSTCLNPIESPTQVPRYNREWMEGELELVERGNHWKEGHGEPLVFTDLAEEALFYYDSGRTKTQRSEQGRVAQWNSREEAVCQVLEHAVGHGVRFDSFWDGMGGGDDWWEVIRFENEDLGQRVKEATRDGFVIPSAEWLQRQAREKEASSTS